MEATINHRLGGTAISADVCVVGAGIVGLAHALEADRRGLKVVVLERDDHQVGASVRNFGHVFVSALADGDELQRGLLARDRWLELAARGALEVRRAGTVLVARDEDELALMEAVASDPARCARMLTRDEVAQLVPIPTGGLIGALYCPLDLRVDPRTAVDALARLLARERGVRIAWREPVAAVQPGVVHAATLTVNAPLIVVCPGPDLRSLPAAVMHGCGHLTRCALQMLRVAAPGGRRYGPGLATGLSLIRYPAFARRPEAAAVRERLLQQLPELLEAGIHLLVCQLPDGDLVIGDSHRYASTPSPFCEERIDELLLGEATRLLGAERLVVRERWQGVYPSAPEGNFLVTAPMPGVRVAQVVSGLGMTLAFALAADVIDQLTG